MKEQLDKGRHLRLGTQLAFLDEFGHVREAIFVSDWNQSAVGNAQQNGVGLDISRGKETQRRVGAAATPFQRLVDQAALGPHPFQGAIGHV